MQNVLDIENIFCCNVLKGLSLKLDDNSFNIILGENGSGKTLLTNSILDIINYKGNIRLYISRNEIGVVTEKNKLLEGTAFFNLMFPLNNLGNKKSESKKKVMELSKKIDVDNLLYKDIKTLNKSQLKIIEVLLAIVCDPKLIIIDDTLDDIDYYYKTKILKLLKQISKKSCILFLTSNCEFLEYADNIFLLDDGIIQKSIMYDQIIDEEKILNKMHINVPFNIELSNKLKLYNVLKNDVDNMSDMVDDIWG